MHFIVVTSLVIHIPLRWLSSCLWSSTYHSVGCRHATGHPRTTPLVVLMPLVTYPHAAGHPHIPLLWLSSCRWSSPHTTPMVIVMPLVIHIPPRWLSSYRWSSTYHSVGFTVFAIDRALQSCLSCIIVALLLLLALVATLSLFISSNGGLRGTRVGAEE